MDLKIWLNNFNLRTRTLTFSWSPRWLRNLRHGRRGDVSNVRCDQSRRTIFRRTAAGFLRAALRPARRLLLLVTALIVERSPLFLPLTNWSEQKEPVIAQLEKWRSEKPQNTKQNQKNKQKDKSRPTFSFNLVVVKQQGNDLLRLQRARLRLERPSAYHHAMDLKRTKQKPLYLWTKNTRMFSCDNLGPHLYIQLCSTLLGGV